jgi:hypothetical protein
MSKIKFILSALIFMIATSASAQKQKITLDKETGLISVDGTAYAHLSKENAPGQLGINKNYTISNLQGEELIYMVFTQEDIYDVYGRKTGNVNSFYVINFFESGESSRKKNTLSALGAAKLVGRNNLIRDGQIDAAAEKKFHMKY